VTDPARPPATGAPLGRDAQPEHAAGIPAVASSVRHVVGRAGVRGLRQLQLVNQFDGFDCPSCAWADPDDDRSLAEFCENGAKAVADAADRHRADPAFFAEHTIDDLLSRSDRWLNDAGRLTHPMLRRPGSDHLEPVTWARAERMVAEHLGALDHPDRAVFYTSGRASNEAAFLYQLWARSFGTNNLPDCSNMCHESSGTALSGTVGIGKGSVRLRDLEVADVVVVLGQNPGTNAPRMLTALQACVEGGGTVVSVNPMDEVGLSSFVNPQDLTDVRRAAGVLAGHGTAIAKEHLQVRIGGDLALLTGVQKALVEAGGVDDVFVAEQTTGFEALRDHLAGQPWEPLEKASGIGRDRMRWLAALLAGTDRIVWCWAMGITQHEHAVGTIQQLANLALLRGAIGRDGAGLCPVRGHSNVQGDRTVGIWERPPAEFLDRLVAGVGGDFAPPYAHGHDVVQSIEAAGRDEVDVFVALGGNLLQAAPDTDVSAAALGRVHLGVHVATKLNRGHLLTGRTALLLPCTSRTEAIVSDHGEQFVTVESSMGVVSRSRGRMTPASRHLRSEPRIVAGLAAASVGDEDPVHWVALADDLDATRDLIEACVPGFDDYNLRVRRDGGFELPNNAREADWSSLPDRRAVLTTYPVPTDTRTSAELTLMTVRSHDQFNTTVYGDDDRYRGVRGDRRVVFLAPGDARRLGVTTGSRVDVHGLHDDGVERALRGFRVVVHDLPEGDCAAYFPEANPLVPLGRTAIGSNTPISKAVAVQVVPA
jgi:molybdopterin-dependent oxidoreductase alpha subunit